MVYHAPEGSDARQRTAGLVLFPCGLGNNAQKDTRRDWTAPGCMMLSGQVFAHLLQACMYTEGNMTDIVINYPRRGNIHCGTCTEKEIPAGGKDGTDPSAGSGAGSSGSGSGDDPSGDNKSSGSAGGESASGDAGSPEAPAKQADSGGDGGAGAGGDDTPKDGFWNKNKKWIVPAGIGVAGLGIIAVAAHAMSPKPTHGPHPAKPLHGTPGHKGKNHRRKTNKHHKLKSKALL